MWAFDGIQTPLVWRTTVDFRTRVVVRVGLRTPYKGGLCAMQGGAPNLQVFPIWVANAEGPTVWRFGALAQERGVKESPGGYLYRQSFPLDVALWHAK